MVQLQKDAEKFKDAKLRVVGISYDKVDVLKQFSESSKVSLTLLSDAGSETIKAYGLHFKKGLPYPGTIVIDKEGNIRARLFKQGYIRRHPNADLLEAAQKLASKKGE